MLRLNHLDFDADLTYFIATCEFDGTSIKFDSRTHRIIGRLTIDMTPSGVVHEAATHNPKTCGCRPTARCLRGRSAERRAVIVIDGATSAKWVSSLQASARTRCTPAATARRCTWSTEARTSWVVPRTAEGR